MSCFSNGAASNLYENCCKGSCLCSFDGDLDCVMTAPIYVQQVFDAVKFNLQGMKTFNDQAFSPCLPQGSRIKRVIDIRCKKAFNPNNIDDPCNLTLKSDTSISGATFLTDAKGHYLKVVGADGTYSERIMYAETTDCDENCKGTPVFGTHNVSIFGNVIIELDLLVCDACNHESVFTVCTSVNLATAEQPMVLTNFFEICMPSTIDTAFLPRFTEFSNSACEARLATNNCGRDLNVDCNGIISGNLIVAICLTCEKKIVVPVQLCVLTTGYADAPLQRNAVCTTFPSLFPQRIGTCDPTSCAPPRPHHVEPCDGHDDDHCEPCEEPPHKPPHRPQPKR